MQRTHFKLPQSQVEDGTFLDKGNLINDSHWKKLCPLLTNIPIFREWECTEVGLIHWLCPGIFFFFSFCGEGDYFIEV